MKSIAFIVPYGNLDSIPTLVGIASALAENGCIVDLFYCPFPSKSRWSRPIAGVSLIELKYNARKGFVARTNELVSWVRQVVHLGNVRSYDLVIGIDASGLIAAACVARRLRIPYAYFSLEITFFKIKQIRLSTTLQKLLECIAIRSAIGVLIQDAKRANLLFRSCLISSKPFVELPNSWRGPSCTVRSNVLREKLGIGPNRTIILHIGSCLSFTCLAELAEVAGSWPPSMALVIQTRSGLGQTDYESRVFRTANNQTVYLLQEPCPADSFLSLVSSADIGLCFYRDKLADGSIDKNLQYVGKSSGKFSTYLQAGVPVIVNTIGGVSQYVEKYGCGVVVSAPRDVQGAVCTILADKEKYINRVRTCFESEFSAKLYEHRAVTRIHDWISINKQVVAY